MREFIETFLSVFSCTASAVIIVWFFVSFLGFSPRIKHKRLHAVAWVVFNVIIAYPIAIHFPEHYIVKEIIYIICYFLWSIALLKGSVISKLFMSAATVFTAHFLNVSTHDLFMALTGKQFPHIANIISVIFLFAVLFVLKRLYPRDSIRLSPGEWIFGMALMTVSFAAAHLIHSVQASVTAADPSIKLLLVEICLTMVILIFIFMLLSIGKYNRERQYLRDYNIHKESRIYYAENIRLQYGEMLRIREKAKQNYEVLRQLAGYGSLGAVREYVEGCINDIVLSETNIDVGNDTLSALLNTKILSAKYHNIQVICTADKSVGGIDELDLFGLVGKMIDSTVEIASSSKGVKYMEISISSQKGGITIFCGALDSESEYSELSRNIIRGITEKYNGSVSFYHEENMTCCKALLRCAEKRYVF